MDINSAFRIVIFGNSHKTKSIEVKKYLSRIENTEFNGIDNGYDFTLTLPKLDSSKEYFVPIMKYNETVILKDEIMTIDISNKDETKK